MSVTMAFGLLLQLGAVILVAARMRSRAMANAGSIYVFVMVGYHGVTELVQFAFPNRNTNRLMTTPTSIDAVVLLSGATILLYSIVYLIVRGSPRERPPARAFLTLAQVRIPLYVLALAAALLRVSGTVSSTPLGTDSATGYWETGLVAEYGDFAIYLSAIALLATRKSGTMLVAIVSVLGAVSALAGASRIGVLIAVVTVLSTAIRYGRTVRTSALISTVAFASFLMLAISAGRSLVGRDQLVQGGAKDRVEGLVGGVQHLDADEKTTGDVIDDFVYRFDGNSFAALVYDRYADGAPPAGWTPLLASGYLMIPSFILRDKLSDDPLLLNEKFLAVLHFGLPLGDYTQGAIANIYAMLGLVGLPLFALFAGSFFAWSDRWLARSESLFAVVTGVGLLRCVTYFEWGLAIYLSTARALGSLYALLVLWRALTTFRWSGRTNTDHDRASDSALLANALVNRSNGS